MFTMRPIPALAAIFILLLHAHPAAGQGNVDFNSQIRPLLSNKCFACHGPDGAAREADLRLDLREEAVATAVVPGAPQDSELLDRILSDDDDYRMPPASHGRALTATEAELIRRWIAAGAHYDRHWSYQKPRRVTIPDVKSDWPVNAIDHFVLNRLQQQKLQPSGLADRYSIIRRLSLDITGLPPTVEEVQQFLNDNSPSAYENLVDHFLAKPAYAERWAAVWLDLARYADSAGYAEDKPRTIWAYRDYVIRSYEENKPFDQFTIEQIAGDLQPDATDETRIATAFHRNTLTNSEGGTSDEEFRNAAVIDRVNTTMSVWMGTTIACAQCHSHKYDPITQQEYFRFFDFFNHTQDNDQPNESPVLPVFSADDRRLAQQLKSKIARLENRLAQDPRNTEANLPEWEAALRDNRLPGIHGRYIRIELPGNGRILSLAEVQVYSDGVNTAGSGKASQSSTAYNGPAELAIDGNTSGNFDEKSVTHTATESHPWWQVDLGQSRPIDRITVWNRSGGEIHRRLDGFQLSILDSDRNVVWFGTFPATRQTENPIPVSQPPPDIIAIAKKLAERRTDQESKKLTDFLKQYARNRQPGHMELIGLRSKLANLRPMTTVPVMVELGNPKRRQTRVQIRGNFQDTTDAVSADTPQVFHSLSSPGPRDRLGIAHWLVDQNNPLTARVLVNRYWEQLFGTGIVATSEEFGTQGELPTHPELLDYLALELMQQGWNTKRLLRQIVMSATYRQSSAASADQTRRDPNNRWLGRGPRVRISAEMIRDQALAVSGLLSDKMYGPPVHPPKPKVGLKPAFTGRTTDWTDSVGPDRYRRAIYTEWRRSAPYPSMATFDVSNREVCEIRRSRTNTPLQALVTLNDPVFIEAAQALALRMMASGEQNPRSIAALGFQLCLVRPPAEAELDVLTLLFREARDGFNRNAEDARMLAVDPLNPPKHEYDMAELAAWTAVANVLLNLDEMFMKP